MVASVRSKVIVFFFVFRGKQKYIRKQCPAREATCHTCTKIGHYTKACKAKKMEDHFCLCCYADDGSHYVGIQTVTCKLNGARVQALLDLGSTHSYVDKQGGQ